MHEYIYCSVSNLIGRMIIRIYHADINHNEYTVYIRGGICPCRHSRRQCKIFASGVNFSIFTHFFVLVGKTVEIRWNCRCKIFSLKIRRCKFLDKFHVWCYTQFGRLGVECYSVWICFGPNDSLLSTAQFQIWWGNDDDENWWCLSSSRAWSRWRIYFSGQWFDVADVHVLVDLLQLIIMGLVRIIRVLPEDSGLMLLMFISLLNIDVHVLIILLIIMGLVRMTHILPEESGLMLLMFVSLLNIAVHVLILQLNIMGQVKITHVFPRGSGQCCWCLYHWWISMFMFLLISSYSSSWDWSGWCICCLRIVVWCCWCLYHCWILMFNVHVHILLLIIMGLDRMTHVFPRGSGQWYWSVGSKALGSKKRTTDTSFWPLLQWKYICAYACSYILCVRLFEFVFLFGSYQIIVADAADAVSVNFSGRCKFLQI